MRIARQTRYLVVDLDAWWPFRTLFRGSAEDCDIFMARTLNGLEVKGVFRRDGEQHEYTFRTARSAAQAAGAAIALAGVGLLFNLV